MTRAKVGVAIEGRAGGLVVEGGLQADPSSVGGKGDGGGQGVTRDDVGLPVDGQTTGVRGAHPIHLEGEVVGIASRFALRGTDHFEVGDVARHVLAAPLVHPIGAVADVGVGRHGVYKVECPRAKQFPTRCTEGNRCWQVLVRPIAHSRKRCLSARRASANRHSTHPPKKSVRSLRDRR